MEIKTAKRIPITNAKDIAKKQGYSQVIIHAFDGVTNRQHVTTYGLSENDAANAAAGGNAIKKMLKWPEDLCNAKTARQRSREKITKENLKLKELLNNFVTLTNNPMSQDLQNLVKYVGLSVIAEKYLKEIACS